MTEHGITSLATQMNLETAVSTAWGTVGGEDSREAEDDDL